MKPKLAVVAALMMVAAMVSDEFAAVTDRAARIGESWLADARSFATREVTSCLGRSAASAVVRRAKS